MRIGAKGRGPGEYLNPRGIGMSDGRLYVFDYNTQNILTYGEDGSFISSSSQSALMNSGIYLSSFFFSGGDMILYYSSNSPVQDMLRWDAASDELAVISRGRTTFSETGTIHLSTTTSMIPFMYLMTAVPSLLCSCG